MHNILYRGGGKNVFGQNIYPCCNFLTDIPKELRLQVMQLAILLMPDENRDVLQTLLLFLNEVASHSYINQMCEKNLATCFVPAFFHLCGGTLKYFLKYSSFFIILRWLPFLGILKCSNPNFFVSPVSLITLRYSPLIENHHAYTDDGQHFPNHFNLIQVVRIKQTDPHTITHRRKSGEGIPTSAEKNFMTHW